MLDRALQEMETLNVSVPQAPQQTAGGFAQVLMALFNNPFFATLMVSIVHQDFISKVQSYVDDPQGARKELLQEVRLLSAMTNESPPDFDIPYILEEMGIPADEQEAMLQHPCLLGLLAVALVCACSQSKEIFAWTEDRKESSVEETIFGLFLLEPGCLFAMIEEACPNSIVQFKENMRQDLQQSVRVPIEPMTREEVEAYMVQRLQAIPLMDFLSGLMVGDLDLQQMFGQAVNDTHQEETKEKAESEAALLAQLAQNLSELDRQVNDAYQAMCKERGERVALYRENPNALRQHFVQFYRENPQEQGIVQAKYEGLPLDPVIVGELLKLENAPVNFSVATIHAFSEIPEALVAARERTLSAEEIQSSRTLKDDLGESLYAKLNQCRAEYLVNNFYSKR